MSGTWLRRARLVKHGPIVGKKIVGVQLHLFSRSSPPAGALPGTGGGSPSGVGREPEGAAAEQIDRAVRAPLPHPLKLLQPLRVKLDLQDEVAILGVG